jgi:CubicO group peptidase (beta-lactamase class C family)
MAGVAWATGGAPPAFAIATAPGLACGPDTLWRAASMSKVVTGQVILRVLQGAVGCHPPYGDIPAEALLGWPMRHPDAPDRPVTLGQIASHRAGLSDDGGYLIPPDGSLQGWLSRPGVWGQPGRFGYCNLGFVILAACAEAVSGQRFDHLAQALVLGPLGLTGGFNWSGVTDRKDRIPTFRRDGDRLVAQIDQVVAPAGVSLADGTAADQSGWQAARNPGLFSPQGGLRLSFRGALALAQALGDPPMLAAALDTRDDTGLFQGYGWGIMRLDRPDIYPRPLVGHFANAYGMCGGLWHDRATGLSFAYALNGLPLGDEDDALRPEERAIFAAMAAT